MIVVGVGLWLGVEETAFAEGCCAAHELVDG